MARPLEVVLVRASGLAGKELLRLLAESDLALKSIRLLDRGEAVGERLDFRDDELPVEEAKAGTFPSCDVALFLPGRTLAAELLPPARSVARVVVDASSVSREDAAHPLVLPPVRDEALAAIPHRRTFALPGAAAAQLAAVLEPLRAAAGLARVDAVSLEAVSGAGGAGVEELSAQTIALLNGREAERGAFLHRGAFNVVPQVGPVGGASRDEERTAAEVARLLRGPVARFGLTRVTVPVFFGHTQLVTIETERPLAADAAREALRAAPGVKVVDDPAQGVYPMPILTAGDDHVLVGRIRAVPTGLALVSCADNVVAGTVGPMVRVCERLAAAGLL